MVSRAAAVALPSCADGCGEAPTLRLGPEWGEPLRECAECHAEGEVGAVDYEDGMWSTPPPDHTTSFVSES